MAEHKVVERVTVQVAPEKLPRNSGTITTWIGTERIVRIDELNNITTIIRHDTQPHQMFIIMHDEKTVLEADLPFEMPEHLLPAFADMRIDWNFERVLKNREINGWDCQRFITISGTGPVNIRMEIWATLDTTIDTRRFHAMLGESMEVLPLFKDMVDELFRISPNFAIETTTTIEQLGMRITTVSRVQSISEQPVPEELFTLPEDYTRKTIDFSTYLSLMRSAKPNTDY